MGLKPFFFVILVFLNAALYSQTSLYVSGLVQYGENADREKLELLEDHQIVQLTGNYGYSISGTYTIQNSGDAYQTTLGILFQEWGSSTPYSVEEAGLQFFVNNEQVQYTEVITDRGFAMDNIKFDLIQDSTSWALIDVLFPANSIVEIQVQYTAEFSGVIDDTWLSYNTSYPFAGLQ